MQRHTEVIRKEFVEADERVFWMISHPFKAAKLFANGLMKHY